MTVTRVTPQRSTLVGGPKTVAELLAMRGRFVGVHCPHYIDPVLRIWVTPGEHPARTWARVIFYGLRECIRFGHFRRRTRPSSTAPSGPGIRMATITLDTETTL